MPIGKRLVLIGMSERSSRQGITDLAVSLFEKGAVEQVIVAAMPKLSAWPCIWTPCSRSRIATVCCCMRRS